LQTSPENLIYAIGRALRYAELVDSGKIDIGDLFESAAFRKAEKRIQRKITSPLSYVIVRDL